ncbi:MAG: LLM class flavin-dependent oxidoreductase [Anaerolineaceae bacterium]|nr:LLM class flavin-dependent oxidoreductase [Anaerolineaceae bacterium]
MKRGFVLPGGDAALAADLAREAELAGWDGFFVWEPVWGVDAWVCLTAAAMRTERIRLGTMLSPLSRMRPWKLASESATLDRLSGGRVILSVGLGAIDSGFEAFGEVTDRRTRAELLDEGLEIINGLWRGQPFSWQGKHYQVRETDFAPPPPPLQQPRIPIWVVGALGSQRSMRRALKYDGLLPQVIERTADGSRQAQQASVADLREGLPRVRSQRPSAGAYDVIVEGETPGADPDVASATLAAWRAAGATWWLETMWRAADNAAHEGAIRRRIRQGPPAV